MSGTPVVSSATSPSYPSPTPARCRPECLTPFVDPKVPIGGLRTFGPGTSLMKCCPRKTSCPRPTPALTSLVNPPRTSAGPTFLLSPVMDPSLGTSFFPNTIRGLSTIRTGRDVYSVRPCLRIAVLRGGHQDDPRPPLHRHLRLTRHTYIERL